MTHWFKYSATFVQHTLVSTTCKHHYAVSLLSHRGLLEGARNPFASPIGAQATTFVGHAVMEPTHYKTIAD
jgi:hypothetical protein